MEVERIGNMRSPMLTKAATIYDVAKLAGVSHQTVSRVLSGHDRIRANTRARVAEALEILDYRPNLAARSLANGRPHRVAALTHKIDQVGPGTVSLAACAAAREAGYVLDLVTLDASDRVAIGSALHLLARQDLAGVLALATTDEMVSAFMNTDFSVPSFVAAEPDDALAAQPGTGSHGLLTLVNYLAELGHKRFFHIAGPRSVSSARNRARAYTAALRRRKLTSVGTTHGDWTASSGYAAAREIPMDEGVTAVVAANDEMALGAMRALVERGYHVPADVSVTGVDDIPEAAYLVPSLTTLRVDFVGRGRDAFQQLLARIDGVAPPESTRRPPELVIRESSAPAR